MIYVEGKAEIIDGLERSLARLRAENPLVHQITNYVTANDCANITLAIGASPVMAQDIAEVAEMVEHARALVVNIGTLQADTIKSMFTAARHAKALSIPVIFDPVGVGATHYRTETARRFLQEIKPEIIRCNMSELKVLCGLNTKVKGVDSAAEAGGGEAAAKQLAEKIKGVIAVTGKEDIITDGNVLYRLTNGDALLTKVTGTGCMTTALTASFAAVGDMVTAAVAGIACMGISGEIAAESLRGEEGIGTFKIRLFDAVSRFDATIMKKHIRMIG